MNTRLFSFVGGRTGAWNIQRQATVVGDPLPKAECIDVLSGPVNTTGSSWTLRGITSNERYVERSEKEQLVTRQQGLGRPEARCAAPIPIRKNAAWWSLTQDERRSIFENQSRHIQIGLTFLPAIARRRHHCRDVSEDEPFDFLTWFEYAPRYKNDFELLVAELRASEEWRYVDREIDIRLSRAGA